MDNEDDLDPAVVERVRPAFDAMGKRIVHIGENGMGQVCKLANQIAVVLNNLSMAEALVFAAKSGADGALEWVQIVKMQ